ncbi:MULTISPECIES: Gfo/Idh/MocA family protein [Microbacterium]|uniref:Gfo/Idh/MocA family oxidoreductase n=1 Tax=Microbacterium marmarense TaxID=3122051 RepID=A0ABU8LP02_9MICO
MGQPHRIGIIGLGVISAAYLDTLRDAPAIVITAVADLNEERAADVAATLPTATAMKVAELLASDQVDTVLNLTIPAAHAEIALGAIAAGKNVFTEKPLAVTMDEARAIIDAAQAAGVHVGSAPDTVLGTGTQTARAAIDAGLIGRPMAATATMVTPGHEAWHPHPDFYYLPGGGPLLDMGPYYVAALIHLLGPVQSVIGAASKLRDQRTIATGPRAGETVAVSVYTHVSGVLEHQSGVLTTITTSFDSRATTAAHLEVHGDVVSLVAPDPNQFSGEVLVNDPETQRWNPLAASAGYVDAARGAGLLDFVAAIAEGREPRANGAVALHSLDVMTALLRSADIGARVEVSSSVERPEVVPLTEKSEWRGDTSSV